MYDNFKIFEKNRRFKIHIFYLHSFEQAHQIILIMNYISIDEGLLNVSVFVLDCWLVLIFNAKNYIYTTIPLTEMVKLEFSNHMCPTEEMNARSGYLGRGGGGYM